MTTDLLKPELSFLNNMDLPHKNAWAPFSNYTLQLHMDFHGFKWLISFCACSFQISIIMFIFLYRLTGGDDHADQGGKACLKCFCDTFDSDRCMNSLTRRWMSICSRSMHKRTAAGQVFSAFGVSFLNYWCTLLFCQSTWVTVVAQCITSPRCRAWLQRRAIGFYSVYNSSLHKPYQPTKCNTL